MNIHRSSERKKRRSAFDSKQKAALVGGLIGGLLLIGGVVFVAKRSSLFVVRSVDVKGIPQAHAEQLRNDLAEFSLNHSRISRFLGDRNIIAWDGNPKDFLKMYPQFKDMDIEKNYFSRQIVITVAEREKFGVWCATAATSLNGASSTTSVDIGNESDCY